MNGFLWSMLRSRGGAHHAIRRKSLLHLIQWPGGKLGSCLPSEEEVLIIRPTGKEGLFASNPQFASISRGLPRNATWISRQDAERVSDPSGMPQTQQERYFTTLSIPKDARSQY